MGSYLIGEGEKAIGAKAFQFKLKSVLDMRARQLEQVQQRFALQQNRVIEIKTLLDETHQQIREQMIVSSEDNADPVLAQQRFGYTQYLKLQAQHLGQSLRKEEEQLARIREEMRQAHVKKKSLERLEEKQREDYLKALASQEEKELEDLIISRGKRF